MAAERACTGHVDARHGARLCAAYGPAQFTTNGVRHRAAARATTPRHPAVGALDRLDADTVEDQSAHPPRRGDVPGRDLVGTGEPVARAEGATRTSSTLSCGTSPATSSRLSRRTSRRPTACCISTLRANCSICDVLRGDEAGNRSCAGRLAPTSSSKSPSNCLLSIPTRTLISVENCCRTPPAPREVEPDPKSPRSRSTGRMPGAGEVICEAAPHHAAADDHALGAARQLGHRARRPGRPMWPRQRLIEQEGGDQLRAGDGRSSPSSRGRHRRSAPAAHGPWPPRCRRNSGTSTIRSSAATMISAARCAPCRSATSSRSSPSRIHSRRARGSARSWLRKFISAAARVDVVTLDEQALVQVADNPLPAQPGDRRKDPGSHERANLQVKATADQRWGEQRACAASACPPRPAGASARHGHRGSQAETAEVEAFHPGIAAHCVDRTGECCGGVPSCAQRR